MTLDGVFPDCLGRKSDARPYWWKQEFASGPLLRKLSQRGGEDTGSEEQAPRMYGWHRRSAGGTAPAPSLPYTVIDYQSGRQTQSDFGDAWPSSSTAYSATALGASAEPAPGLAPRRCVSIYQSWNASKRSEAGLASRSAL